MKPNVLIIPTFRMFCLFFSFSSWGQNSVSVSSPMIWSKVKAKDNWTPSTAPNYQEHRNGSAFGYGFNLGYSFQPKPLIKSNQFFINLGLGYFNHCFDIVRPFDYASPLYPIFYTDNYSYHCWNLSAGLNYNYPLSKKYFLSGGLIYSWLNSFRQEYTPTSNHGYGKLTQVNKNRIDFGNSLMLTIGLRKLLGKKFSIELDVLGPLYVRWRNDKIFKDDPSKFSNPKFSLGFNIAASYYLKSNMTHKKP